MATARGQAMADRLRRAGVAFTRRRSRPIGRIAEVGDAVIFLTDGRTATQRAPYLGMHNLVLMDLALDYTKATRLAVQRRSQPLRCRGGRGGLLQAAGYAVSVLRDVPGLAVMRTVAMLANEAADAVKPGRLRCRERRRGDAAGRELPAGPLAWAHAVGV